jgi:hypothetical protein
MKKTLPYLLLVLLMPVCLYFGAAAQEGAGDTGSKDAAAVEKREGEKTDSPARKDVNPSGSEDASAVDTGNKRNAPEGAKKETKKKADRKKKEAKKQPEKKTEEKHEEAVKEETAEADIDRESGDNLLMIDHEKIKYDRIPGITLKKEESGQDLVKIPDDKILEKGKEKPSGGLFGPKTNTIARWGLLLLLFVIFIIYKTRTKKSRKKVVRTITKR